MLKSACRMFPVFSSPNTSRSLIVGLPRNMYNYLSFFLVASLAALTPLYTQPTRICMLLDMQIRRCEWNYCLYDNTKICQVTLRRVTILWRYWSRSAILVHQCFTELYSLKKLKEYIGIHFRGSKSIYRIFTSFVLVIYISHRCALLLKKLFFKFIKA